MKTLLQFLIMLAIFGHPSWATEGFEGYSSDSELRGVWVVRNGNGSGCDNPILSITTKESHRGSKSMRWEYDNGKNQGWESIAYCFPTKQDWSNKENFTFWIKGGKNSAEHITVILYDYPDGSQGKSKRIGEQSTTVEWPTQADEWTRVVMPLDKFKRGEKGNRGLRFINSIEIGIKSTSSDWGYGPGVLHLDTISI